MKKIAIFIMMLICAVSLNAQNYKNYQDVIYLKNGSVIRGTILYQLDNEDTNKSIKIAVASAHIPYGETFGKNIFVYQNDEIEKITKEKKIDKLNQEIKNKGYQGIIELGYIISVDLSSTPWSYTYLKFNIINGYKFNQHISLGIGTGVRYGSSSIPLFIDFRAKFNNNNNNIFPYLSIDVGYVFGRTNYVSAFLFNPNFGVGIKLTDKSSINISIGYELVKNLSISTGISF